MGNDVERTGIWQASRMKHRAGSDRQHVLTGTCPAHLESCVWVSVGRSPYITCNAVACEVIASAGGRGVFAREGRVSIQRVWRSVRLGGLNMRTLKKDDEGVQEIITTKPVCAGCLCVLLLAL